MARKNKQDAAKASSLSPGQAAVDAPLSRGAAVPDATADTVDEGATGVMGAADTTGGKKEPILKAVGSLIFWLGLIVVLKVYVADIFVIPTGSMEPTLHGRDNQGDRIFCTKINYLWRNPKRWEVFVFKYPYMQTSEGERSQYKGENFIKRCVGLPGEQIALRRGDVFVSRDGSPLQRQIKSPAIQDGMWIPVYSEDFKRLSLPEFENYWKVSGWRMESNELVSEGKGAVLTYLPHNRFHTLDGVPDRYFREQYLDFSCPVANCGGKLRKTFRSPMITARCSRCGAYLTEKNVVYYDFRCGYPVRYAQALRDVCRLGDPDLRSSSDWHFVPDLRLQTRAKLAPGAELELQLLDDRHICTARIKAGGGVTILVDGRPLPDSILFSKTAAEDTMSARRELELPGGSLTPEVWHELDFQRIDGTLRLFIDGKAVVLSGLFDLGVPEVREHPQTTSVDLVARGKVQLSRLALDRDIYYFHSDQSAYFSSGLFWLSGYLALGDNQPSSNDSRGWGAVPQENLVGSAIFTWWPPQAMRLLVP